MVLTVLNGTCALNMPRACEAFHFISDSCVKDTMGTIGGKDKEIWR